MAKAIALTKGRQVLVDDEDFEYLSQWKWCCVTNGNHQFRAMRKSYFPTRKTIYMHQVIAMRKFDLSEFPHGMVTDHINGNALDNQRENLRLCTRRQNQMNSDSHVGNSTFKGVSYSERDGFYYARICVNRKTRHLGCFRDEVEAAKAYNVAALEYFGEFARLNPV